MSERIYIKNILDALNPIKFQCSCLIVSIKYEGQVNLLVIYTDNTFPQHKYFFLTLCDFWQYFQEIPISEFDITLKCIIKYMDLHFYHHLTRCMKLVYLTWMEIQLKEI